MLNESDIRAKHAEFHRAFRSGDHQALERMDAWLDETPEAFPVLYGVEDPARELRSTPAKTVPQPRSATQGHASRADVTREELRRQVVALGIVDEQQAVQAIQGEKLDATTAAGRAAIRAGLVEFAIARPDLVAGRPALAPAEVAAAVRKAAEMRDRDTIARVSATYPEELKLGHAAIARAEQAEIQQREAVINDRNRLAAEAQARTREAKIAEDQAKSLAAEVAMVAAGRVQVTPWSADELVKRTSAAQERASSLQAEAQKLAQQLDSSLAELTGQAK